MHDHFTVEGADLLHKALEKGKGCILVTAHWGAVEFIPWVLHTQGIPTSIILECATAQAGQEPAGQRRATATRS